MEIRNLYNNIYIDPLTCLPNFFRFIESDFEEIFDENGAILIFDISCYPKDGSCITELIDKAEKANGLAKDAGKNRVLMWDTRVI